MAWYNFWYKEGNKEENKPKEKKLEIICSECGKEISTPDVMTHQGTTNFYHNDLCALNYYIKHNNFPWMNTIFIHREEALEKLKEKAQESKE